MRLFFDEIEKIYNLVLKQKKLMPKCEIFYEIETKMLGIVTEPQEFDCKRDKIFTRVINNNLIGTVWGQNYSPHYEITIVDVEKDRVIYKIQSSLCKNKKNYNFMYQYNGFNYYCIKLCSLRGQYHRVAKY